MKKILIVCEEIESCSTCFYFYEAKSYFAYGCKHPKSKTRVLNENSIYSYQDTSFPDTCPLEDF